MSKSTVLRGPRASLFLSLRKHCSWHSTLDRISNTQPCEQLQGWLATSNATGLKPPFLRLRSLPPVFPHLAPELNNVNPTKCCPMGCCRRLSGGGRPVSLWQITGMVISSSLCGVWCDFHQTTIDKQQQECGKGSCSAVRQSMSRLVFEKGCLVSAGVQLLVK